ncbi:MAG: hypothetical protein OXC01_10705 [Immundisolibacterales bacterium]|nr:hypothetical protein [Immundisolibacterales bacterium]
MSIQFHDPRAESSRPVETYGLAAALDGPIAIGLLANGFPDSVEFLEAVEEALGESLPEASFTRYDKGGPSVPVTAHLVDDIVERCDAVVAAYGH